MPYFRRKAQRMAGMGSSIYMKRLAEISRIGRACQVFTGGLEEGVLTFIEFREACRLLSTLIRSVDSDAGDLCLLASHAENLEQFKPVCRMSSQSWKTGESRKGM